MVETDARTRHLPPIHPSMFVALDAVLLALAGFLVAALQDRLTPLAFAIDLSQRLFPVAGFRRAWMLLHVVMLPIMFVALGQYRMLQPGTPGWSFPRILFAFVALDLVGLTFLFFVGYSADPIFVLANFALGVAWVSGARGIVNARLRAQVLDGRRVRNALLVGSTPGVLTLANTLVATPILGRRVLGFATTTPVGPAPTGTWTTTSDDAAQAAIVENSLHQPRHIWMSYAATDDAERQKLLDGLGIEEVYADARSDDVPAWLAVCRTRGIDVHVVPTIPNDLGLQPTAWTLGGTVLLDVHRRPMSTLGWWSKRVMDVAGAIVGLTLGMPLMIIAAIAIKIETPSLPIFYPGRRVGLKGRVFRMMKFTTMRADAQKIEENLQAVNTREGPWFKVDENEDPRLTRVGKWIRRFEINEIPQFWNVLKGDMSLVGPRPPTPNEVATYLKYDVRYFQVLDVKPGITGLWQVTARHNPSFDLRLELDLKYMREWSIWMDIGILFKTVGTVLSEGEE